MKMTRIVSFLGTTPYDFARFWDQASGFRSDVHRLTDLATIQALIDSTSPGVRELQVVVLGTIDVWKMWFSGVNGVVGGRYCEDLLATKYHERFDAFELYFLAVTKGVVESADIPEVDTIPGSEEIGRIAVERTQREQWNLFKVMDTAIASALNTAESNQSIAVSSSTDLDKQVALDEPRLVKLMRHGAPLSRLEPEHVILDVSNGFRSQPIFATSAMSYSAFRRRYSGQDGKAKDGGPTIDVKYCAYDRDRHQVRAGGSRPRPGEPAPARDKILSASTTMLSDSPEVAPVPVADLTNVVAADTWLSALSDFLRHGRGDNLQQACLVLAGKLGRDGVPIKQFGRSVKDLSDGVCTLRVQECITRLSAKVFETHERASSLIAKQLPFAVDEFRLIEQLSRRMHTPQLISPEGLAAWIAYGDQCVRWERYTEAIAVAREGYVVALRVRMAPPEGLPDRSWRWQEYESIRVDTVSQVLQYKHSSDYIDLPLGEHSLAEDVRKLAGWKFNASQSRNDALHCGLNENAGQNMRVQATAMIKRLRRELGEIWKELCAPQ